MIRKIKNAFVYGIIVILPVYITFKLLHLVIKLFIGFSHPLIAVFVKNRIVSSFISFFISILFILVAGLIAKKFFGGRLKEYISEVLKGIPVISTIYKAADDVINFVFTGSKSLLKGRAVIVNFPTKETSMIGFVTNERIFDNDERLTVFIPTTPNPTSGFLVIVKKEDVKYIDVSIDDAIKFIISGGLSKI